MPRSFTTTTTFVPGCTYEFSNGNRLVRVKVLHFDAISNYHVVAHEDGRESRLELNKMRNVTKVRRNRNDKINTRDAGTFLYMCDVGAGFYKVGCSSNPTKRSKQIRTCAPLARMLHTFRIKDSKASTWSKCEQIILKHFAQHRSAHGGREVFKMRPSVVQDCARMMRKVAQTGA